MLLGRFQDRLVEVGGVRAPLGQALRAALLRALAQAVATVALVFAAHEAIASRQLTGAALGAAGVAAVARALGPLLQARVEAVAEGYAAGLRVATLAHAVEPPSLRRGAGAAVAAATKGVDAVARVLGELLPGAVLAVSSALVATAALLVLDPASALIAWLPLLAMPVVAARVSRRNAPLLAVAWRRVGSLAARLTEVVRVLPTLRATGGLDRAVEELDAASASLEQTTSEAMGRALASNLALDFLAGLAIGLVAMGLGFRLMGGQVTLATAVAVLVAVPELSGPARRLAASAHLSRESAVAAEELRRVASLTAPVGAGGRGPRGGSTLELEAVAYQLDDVEIGPLSARLPAGGALVLRGPSGSGKSTLLGLIAGAGTPRSGRVLVDGGPAGAAGTVLVPAAPRVLCASLADNVDLGRGRGEAALREALELVGLGPLLARLPGGLGTQLGVGGRPLSAGEAQRLGLARAVLADPSLLLLDEPTAHLDRASTEQLAEQLGPWLAERSVVVAAHGPTLVAAGAAELRLGQGARA